MKAIGASVLVYVGLAACATQTPAAEPTPQRAALSARCVAIADSVLANTPSDLLAIGTPIGQPRPPRAPADVKPGVMLHASWLIRPDGSADTSTVRISGTLEPSYRSDFARSLRDVAFKVPEVQSCPVWSRGDFRQYLVPAGRAPATG